MHNAILHHQPVPEQRIATPWLTPPIPIAERDVTWSGIPLRLVWASGALSGLA